jgi:hypothetical protein
MPPEGMALRETMIAERPMMMQSAQEFTELNNTMMSSEFQPQLGAQLNGVMKQVSGGVVSPQEANVRETMRWAGVAERSALVDLMESSFMDWKQSMNELQQSRPMQPSISKSSIKSWRAAPGVPQPEISKSALVRGSWFARLCQPARFQAVRALHHARARRRLVHHLRRSARARGANRHG